MTEDNPSLSELGLSDLALNALHAHGLFRLNDLRPLTNIQILKLPNVGGQSYKRLLVALGRRA